MSPIMEITTVVLVDVNSPANVIIVVRLGTISMSVIQRKVAIDIEKWQENDQVELAFNCFHQIDHDCVCIIDGKIIFLLICDTGASFHIIYDDDSMLHVKTVNETVHKSSGTMKATKMGKKNVHIKQLMQQLKMLSFNL